MLGTSRRLGVTGSCGIDESPFRQAAAGFAGAGKAMEVLRALPFALTTLALKPFLRFDLQVIACLINGKVPANLHFAELNPHIELVGLAIPTQAPCLEDVGGFRSDS